MVVNIKVYSEFGEDDAIVKLNKKTEDLQISGKDILDFGIQIHFDGSCSIYLYYWEQGGNNYGCG